MHDVVVTGVGMVTPLGITAKETAAAWRDNRPITMKTISELSGTPLEDVAVPVLPPFDAPKLLGGRKMMKFMSWAAVLGCIAAKEALRDAGATDRFHAERIGLFAGVGIPSIEMDDVRELIRESIDEDGRFSARLLGERGLGVSNPLVAFKILPNMPPCIISLMEGLKGPSYIFTPWEGQTGAAFLEAWQAVANGEVDCALAGAADTATHPSNFLFLSQSGLLEGFEFPSVGAGYLVLEKLETARKANVPIHAHISNMDLNPSDDGIVDPLASRIGRTFAAAPAIMGGLTSLCGGGRFSICGTDRQEITMVLES